MSKSGWVVSFVLICIIASCSGNKQVLAPAQTPAPVVETAPTEFPFLADLDSYHLTSVISNAAIPVAQPTTSHNTLPENDTLWLLPRDSERAWAIYRVFPPDGELLHALATGSDTLWLGVADYGNNRWSYAGFSEGNASMDFATLDFPYSPEGYVYLAIICPVDSTGLLESLALEFDSIDWGLTIETWNDRLMLSWNELPYDSYQIYRSTLADDIAPYHVGSTPELELGPNHHNEFIPENGAGEWVPEINDNGTRYDLEDDFPTIAPGVEYYYRIRPVLRGVPLGYSPELHDRIDWGERTVVDRPWPISWQSNLLFTTGLDIEAFTEEQLQWTAEHYFGSISQSKDEADMLRAYNPDFTVLGINWLTVGGESKARFGNTLDLNSDFPYVNKHESWFEHPEGSTQFNGRAGDTENGKFFLTDTSSEFKEYYSLRSLEQLGENHLDGWIGWSIYPLWSVEPGTWWAGDDPIVYQSPKIAAAFTTTQEVSLAHPQSPLNFASVFRMAMPGSYWHDPDSAYDLSAADGVYAENYIFTDNHGMGTTYYPSEWEESQNRSLAYNRDAGKLILNINRPVSYGEYDRETLFEYCSYLLIQGDNTYYHLKPSSDGKPRWYPELDWDLGAPLDDQPNFIAELEWHPYGGDSFPTLYRREFENGTIYVYPEKGFGYSIDLEEDIEVLIPYGGGVVGDDGIPDGYIDWELRTFAHLYFPNEEGQAYIVRPAV